MWFQMLGLVIAAALIAKATVALIAPQRFYAARRWQYDCESPPRKLLAAPLIVGMLTAIAWYATFFHYRPAGWVVTVFLTAVFYLAVSHLFNWPKHRQIMLRVVSGSNLWLVDCVLLTVGFVFAALAFVVY